MDMDEVENRGHLGKEAEDLAAGFLEGAGYVVRARNVRYTGGELDLVVEQGELLAFVEVRMRSNAEWGVPTASISWKKQRRVVLAAMRYLALERIRDRPIRFDVISVLGRGTGAVLEHIPNAF